MVWIVLGVWLACGAAAFWLFCDSWRQSFDVGRRDATLFGFLSLVGPASLLAAALIWLAERDWGPSPTIWRQHDRRL
jgi:glycerol-3-phosphate acyltransferase PlsY